MCHWLPYTLKLNGSQEVVNPDKKNWWLKWAHVHYRHMHPRPLCSAADTQAIRSPRPTAPVRARPHQKLLQRGSCLKIISVVGRHYTVLQLRRLVETNDEKARCRTTSILYSTLNMYWFNYIIFPRISIYKIPRVAILQQKLPHAIINKIGNACKTYYR